MSEQVRLLRSAGVVRRVGVVCSLTQETRRLSYHGFCDLHGDLAGPSGRAAWARAVYGRHLVDALVSDIGSR